jgi:Dethiobiotin synthetase
MVIEGAGGWLTPINRRQTLGDWAASREIPVLLVVGIRLGCLNHAQLSAQAIGARMVGWVASVPPPELREWQENVDDLKHRLPAPLLGVAACGCSARELARALVLPAGFTRPIPAL